MYSDAISHDMVSIIMPVYNSGKYINDAVRSVLEQTWNNFELIIVNDGSTDGTLSYLDNIYDSRIKLVSQENKGVSCARNVGLSLSRGEYIAFLDADDTFTKDSIEKRVKFLIENKDVDIVGGQVKIMDSEFNEVLFIKKPNYRGYFLPKLIKLDNQIISSVSYMIRRKIANNYKFEESMTHCEDILYLIKISCGSQAIYASINSCIYNYRVHESSATSKEDGWRCGFIALIRNINKIKEIKYRTTIIMRIKILIMLIKWHIKRKTLKKIYQLFYIFL